MPLAEQRCCNHGLRSAAGRCPCCYFFYCRECITEHDGRLLCANCVGKQKPEDETGARSNPLWTVSLLGSAFALTWLLIAAAEGLLAPLLQPR